MGEKRRAEFLKAVAEAARRRSRKPRGLPMPGNMTDEGRRLGLEAIARAPRCRTIRSNGEACKNPAMRGATRCLKHGGRVEVPAHPHNVRRFLAGEFARTEDEQDHYRRSRGAWDRMTPQEQREFVGMLPSDIANKSRLIIYATDVWQQVQDQGYVAWSRLLRDLRARVMEAE